MFLNIKQHFVHALSIVTMLVTILAPYLATRMAATAAPPTAAPTYDPMAEGPCTREEASEVDSGDVGSAKLPFTGSEGS